MTLQSIQKSQAQEEDGGKPIIQLIEVTKHYSGVKALSNICTNVASGELHGLIGTNGSGKSTLFNLISGSLPLTSGKIIYDGMDVTDLGAYRVSRLGVGRTFQAGTVVPTLSCLDNVLLGFSTRLSLQLIRGLIPVSQPGVRSEKQLRAKALELLEQQGLADYAYSWAGDLIWAQKQKLQIARAIANDPKLLLLDEPTAGMGPEETHEIEELVRTINHAGITVMIVSHDVSLISRLCSHVTVLMSGKLVCSGRPETVFSNAAVKKAYLGHGE